MYFFFVPGAPLYSLYFMKTRASLVYLFIGDCRDYEWINGEFEHAHALAVITPGGLFNELIDGVCMFGRGEPRQTSH